MRSMKKSKNKGRPWDSPELHSQEIQACLLLIGYIRLSGTELGQKIHGHKKSRKPQGYALIGNKIGQGLVKKGYCKRVNGEYRNYYELLPEYQNQNFKYFESKLKKG